MTPSTAPGIRIVRLTIGNFMGIETLDLELPAGGAVIAGANGKGKTSVLKAIQAALTGEGVDPSAIRAGASKAEILLDLGHVTVQRVLTAKGSRLKVTDVAAQAAKLSPQAFLNELLGASPIDPLRFWSEKDAKKRRAMILSALPAHVLPEQILAWCPGLALADLARLVGAGGLTPGVPLAEHGLEVIATVRRAFYERRTTANATAEARAQDLQRAQLAAQAVEADLGPGPVLPVVEADRALVEVMHAARDAFDQARNAEAWKQRSAGTKRRVGALRADASAKRAAATAKPTEAELREARAVEGRAAASFRSIEHQIAELTRQLAAARTSQSAAWDAQHALELRVEDADAAEDAARLLEEQALDLEDAIGSPPTAPTEAEVADLAARRAMAERAVERARKAERVGVVRADAQQAQERATEAAHAAAGLDTIVRRLTQEAPLQLLASTTAIPGLAVSEDDILLDGVSLDRLCGAERLKFAVDVARRLSKGRFLIVDGLEVLDQEHLPLFLAHATRGGFQLIATRVAEGPSVVEPIGGAS